MRRARLFLTLLLLAGSLALAAVPPPLVNYQGVLRDQDDEPLDGTFDMTFRFFDALAAGNEILVDAHSGGGGVVVSGGLFSVALGSGVVADGSGVFAGDPYDALDNVFRDFSDVWMELEVDGETLAPRIQVLSAAYALNASNLGGLAAGEYIDTTTNAQQKEGGLTVGSLDSFGNIRLRNEFFTSIHFADGGDPQAESIAWDSADHVFQFSAGLQTDGAVWVGNTTDLPTGYNRFSASSFPDNAAIGDVEDVYVGDDFEADGDVFFNGNIFVDDDGPDGDQHIWFWNDGAPVEELKWDETAERFEFSDSLAIPGSLRTGSTQQDPEGFNHFGNLGKSPDSDDMSGPQDVYVEGDVEIEERLYLAGELIMLDLGPDTDGDGDPNDIDQNIFFYDGGTMDDEWLQWDNDIGDGTDRFEFSDSLHVFGFLTSNAKGTVQNHPEHDDQSIVYNSLEGDEAGVFTRGQGRLQDGEARVPLGGTFRYMANPDLGLSAHLTPRGGWADLYVAELTSAELVVRSADPTRADGAFDYIVFGLRLGYEDQPVVRRRTTDAPLPPEGYWDAEHAANPASRRQTALARYAALEKTDVNELDLSASRALRAAIGQRDPEEPVDDRPTAAGDSTDGATADRVSRETVVSNVAAMRSPEPDGNAATGTESRALHARTLRTESAGLAGAYRVRGDVVPGDVVVIDPDDPALLRRAERAEDPTVVGIVSTDAGVVLQGDGFGREADRMAVALGGIVECRVDASYGAILPGDLLVTSATPGHAMRARDPLPGTVLGKALEPLAAGAGSIRVLVMQR